MTLNEYVRDPAPAPSLSASVAHLLLTRSARHAWLEHPRLNPLWAPEESGAMDIGTVCHAILLEGDDSRVEVIDAPDWRTRAAKEARDAARARGKIPILTARCDEIAAMVNAAQTAIEAAPEIRDAFAQGTPEQTLIWREDDVYCRCRPDFVTDDHRLILSYKTTSGSAEPEAWARGPLLNLGADVQGAFELHAVRTHHAPRDCSVVYLVQETDPPYAMSFVGLSPEFEAFAERKRRAALLRWKHCLELDQWPGYPARIAWAEPPAWAVTRWEEARMVTDGEVDDL